MGEIEIIEKIIATECGVSLEWANVVANHILDALESESEV